jgi:PTH1 family peptidyl-tRNA hydrolase
MALFDRKRTNYETVAPLYTIGNSQTLLVIGLGNIGSKYAKTRHNVGFMVLDKYQTTHDFSGWINKKDLACELSIGQVGATRVILIKPTTFMNNSGESVQKVQKFYQIYNSDTLVVHDELDIEFGTIRTRSGGSSAGHKGIKSLSSFIGDDYGRVRVGIGPKTNSDIDSADFVLQNFNAEQQEKLPNIINEVCSIIDERTAGPLFEQTLTV